MRLTTLLGTLSLSVAIRADVTVYGQIPLAQTATTVATAAAVTTYAAYNDTLLTPPAVPNPAPATSYTISVQREAANVYGLSISHAGGSFWGFSIEMSVINQVLGRNSSYIQVPFLNLMQNLVERAGSVFIRLGGNTQEHATMVDYIDKELVITKEKTNLSQTTETPAVLYTVDLFYLTNNISSLTNVKWFFGIPFNDSVNWRLAIAEYGQTILGDNLVGLQAGNEPDFYDTNGHRDETYTVYDYYGEMGLLVEAIDANSNIPNKNMLIAPNLGGGGNGWTPEQVWETGFLNSYVDRLYALAVEHYPNNNCALMYNTGAEIINPQDVFGSYLNHNAGIDLCSPYLAASMVAQQHNKPMYMFETNTASCGGFQGISDSYGAALWALDYGFQMAYSNFTHALMHIGGQNDFYNPFTAPPTNQSTYNEWTIGAVYYSVLVIAEAFGKTNTSRIMDMQANENSIYTPAYAIYENDVLSKMALFNYVDDNTGASDRIVTITVPNSGVPSSVKIKYLSSPSVSVKNITWAGQTFGSKFQVDGRLEGQMDIVTIACDTTANTCQIPLKAPDFALVFLSSSDEALSLSQATQTFPTTAHTKTQNTATIDASLLSTSNGHSGSDRGILGSTSSGSVSGAEGSRAIISSAMVLLSVLVGGWWCVVMGILR